MPDEYVHVGAHAHILASGRPVGPGDRVAKDELDSEDRWLLDDEHLVAVDSFSKRSNEPEKTKSKPTPKED